MKQIIVNVSGLSTEEKHRVNEALAKITGFSKMTSDLIKANWMYAPSSHIGNHITYSNRDKSYENKEPTHTPQQVLEMAGMAEKRKVRADFDPKQPISVDVSNCTEEEKEEVQQAFFDVGIEWFSGRIGCEAEVTRFRYLDATLYTNSTPSGTCHGHLMYGNMSRTDSISHQQFLSMVYEAEQQGHTHAHLMAQYAEDAKTNAEPWKLWQIKVADKEWRDLTCNPSFATHLGYRHKPSTRTVSGVEIPNISFTPNVGEMYYYPNPILYKWATDDLYREDCKFTRRLIELNLCYPFTDEGRKVAISHAKAMLEII